MPAPPSSSQVRTSPFQGDGSGSNPLGGARGFVERFLGLCFPALHSAPSNAAAFELLRLSCSVYLKSSSFPLQRSVRQKRTGKARRSVKLAASFCSQASPLSSDQIPGARDGQGIEGQTGPQGWHIGNPLEFRNVRSIAPGCLQGFPEKSQCLFLPPVDRRKEVLLY